MMRHVFRSVVLAGALAASCGPGPTNDPGMPPVDDTPATTKPTTFTVKLANVTPFQYAKSGTFNMPVGATAPGPIHAGEKYEFTFTAGKPHRLSFAVMFGASNDWFFAPDPAGIALYENGLPVTGDVTSQIHLYNAGTEVDQEPGVGADTGPKQMAKDQGAPDPDNKVREITSPVALTAGGTFPVPAVKDMLKVSISTTGKDREFKVTVENVSQPDTLKTSEGNKGVGISPGVWVLHTAPNALFELGKPDRGEGLERIAENGGIDDLKAKVVGLAGLQTGFSPLVYVVHKSGNPLFKEGEKDRGQGLELIAESGRIQTLKDALAAKLPDGASASGAVDMPDGATKAGPIGAGGSYTFEVSAAPGDRLSFASMLGASDDWFVGVSDAGLPLFDDKGQPLSGDQSAALTIWNAGTEVDEEPGVGADTGPNQSAPDQGTPDADPTVRKLDASLYPVAATKHLTLTIAPK